jgi:hypothetical protein
VCVRERERETWADLYASNARGDASLHVPVLVGRHLGQAEHGVLAAQAVVVRLLARVHATAGLAARLRRGELLEPGGHDRVEFLVLAPVRHHFVGVGAHELALETVEVRRLVLAGTCVRKTGRVT